MPHSMTLALNPPGHRNLGRGRRPLQVPSGLPQEIELNGSKARVMKPGPLSGSYPRRYSPEEGSQLLGFLVSAAGVGKGVRVFMLPGSRHLYLPHPGEGGQAAASVLLLWCLIK